MGERHTVAHMHVSSMKLRSVKLRNRSSCSGRREFGILNEVAKRKASQFQVGTILQRWRLSSMKLRSVKLRNVPVMGFGAVAQVSSMKLRSVKLRNGMVSAMWLVLTCPQ